MKMHVKKGAIITVHTRNGESFSGRVLTVSDYDVVLKPQAYVYKSTLSGNEFVRFSDVEDIMVDNPKENEQHIDKNEINSWKYFTIERDKENSGPCNVYSLKFCTENGFAMSKNDNPPGFCYCHYGSGEFIE